MVSLAHLMQQAADLLQSICHLFPPRFEDGPPYGCAALATASIIKVIMAGQRMRQPARDPNGSYTALLAAEADIHPSMAMYKLRPGGAIVRPPYPRVTGAFTGRCLMRPGGRRTR